MVGWIPPHHITIKLHAMSTRANVWILNKKNGGERILYHHCDGYMLDEEIDPILRDLPDDKWTVKGVAEAIIDFDEAYGKHSVDSVGWDSEFVYKIEVTERKMEKFDCGISDTIRGDRKEEKTQEKQRAIDKYLNEPTTENAKRLKELGVKPATVKKARQQRKLDNLHRTEANMSKKERKEYQDLLKFTK